MKHRFFSDNLSSLRFIFGIVLNVQVQTPFIVDNIQSLADKYLLRIVYCLELHLLGVHLMAWIVSSIKVNEFKGFRERSLSCNHATYQLHFYFK